MYLCMGATNDAGILCGRCLFFLPLPGFLQSLFVSFRQMSLIAWCRWGGCSCCGSSEIRSRSWNFIRSNRLICWLKKGCWFWFTKKERMKILPGSHKAMSPTCHLEASKWSSKNKLFGLISSSGGFHSPSDVFRAKMGSIKKWKKPNTSSPIYRIGCSYPIDFNINRDDLSNDLRIWGDSQILITYFRANVHYIHISFCSDGRHLEAIWLF